jgi:hypothetical protein
MVRRPEFRPVFDLALIYNPLRTAVSIVRDAIGVKNVLLTDSVVIDFQGTN